MPEVIHNAVLIVQCSISDLHNAIFLICLVQDSEILDLDSIYFI